MNVNIFIPADHDDRQDFCSVFDIMMKFAAKLHKIRPYFTNPLTEKNVCAKMTAQG